MSSVIGNIIARLVVEITSIFMVLYCVGAATAMIHDGYTRRLYDRFVDWHYPPLDEWEESLEERGAFEVDTDA